MSGYLGTKAVLLSTTAATVTGSSTVGAGLTVDNDGATVLTVDRATSDGTIVDVQRGGSSVGGISSVVNSYIQVGSGNTGVVFNSGVDAIIPHNGSATRDAVTDLGLSSGRFKDLYLSGGVYLGGTGSANKLDDYEEGTWTPSAYQGSISFASAWYIKVGNLVTVGANVYNFSDTTTANGVGIKDLPFTSASSATATGAFIGKNIASSTGYSAYIGTSDVAVYFYEAPESSNTYEIMKHNDLTSASDFHFCITYKSA